MSERRHYGYAARRATSFVLFDMQECLLIAAARAPTVPVAEFKFNYCEPGPGAGPGAISDGRVDVQPIVVVTWLSVTYCGGLGWINSSYKDSKLELE